MWVLLGYGLSIPNFSGVEFCMGLKFLKGLILRIGLECSSDINDISVDDGKNMFWLLMATSFAIYLSCFSLLVMICLICFVDTHGILFPLIILSSSVSSFYVGYFPYCLKNYRSLSFSMDSPPSSMPRNRNVRS
jgi:hypothetical protein